MEGTTSTTVAHYENGNLAYGEPSWYMGGHYIGDPLPAHELLYRPHVPAPWTIPVHPANPVDSGTATHTVLYEKPKDEIRLTMAEVAALQRAAEADEEVRSVLNKIAKRIKVDVEF